MSKIRGNIVGIPNPNLIFDMGVIQDDSQFDRYRGNDYSDGYYFLGMFSTQNQTNIDEIGLFESLNAEGGLEQQRKFMFSDEGLKIYYRYAIWDEDYRQGSFSDWELVKEITGGGGVTADELNDWAGAFNARLDKVEQDFVPIYYFQNTIGDIETTLDRIIEIQNELLGGDAE